MKRTLLTAIGLSALMLSGCFGYGMKIQGYDGTITNNIPVLPPSIELLNSTPCVITMHAGTVTLDIPGRGTKIRPGETGIIGDHVATIVRACAGSLCVANNEVAWRSVALMMSTANAANTSYVGVVNFNDAQEQIFRGKFGERWEEYKKSPQCLTGERSNVVKSAISQPRRESNAKDELEALRRELQETKARLQAAEEEVGVPGAAELAEEPEPAHETLAKAPAPARKRKPKWIE